MKENNNYQGDLLTYLIVDFEATCCDQERIPRNQMEIIEIGAVAVEQGTHHQIDEFQSFVRPTRNPVLTNFCKDLTSIKQSMVDEAPYFAEVLPKFSDWIKQFKNPVFCSWGFYDKKQLHQDCEYHHLKYPFTDDHINIKTQFAANMGLRKGVGLGKALNRVNMSFQGTAHRGIDDARNMAILSDFIFYKHLASSGKS